MTDELGKLFKKGFRTGTGSSFWGLLLSSQSMSVCQRLTACVRLSQLAGVSLSFCGCVCIKIMPGHSLVQLALPRPLMFDS